MLGGEDFDEVLLKVWTLSHARMSGYVFLPLFIGTRQIDNSSNLAACLFPFLMALYEGVCELPTLVE